MTTLLGNRHYDPRPASGPGLGPDSGFTNIVTQGMGLHPGRYSMLAQVQLPRGSGPVEVRIAVQADDGIIGATRRTLVHGPDDRLLAHFTVPSHGLIECAVDVGPMAGMALLRMLTIVPGDYADPWDPVFDFPQSEIADPEAISCVILGTTTRCPASCVNCPTNKPITAAVPKGVMSLALFRQIIDGLAEINYRGSIVFGLYGEPLLDPHLNDRLSYIREHLPSAPPLLATTGSVYDPKRHARAIAESGGIAIHMEAITAELYDKRMTPLRLARSLPKIERLLVDARHKAHLIMPLNRENLGEIPEAIRLTYKTGAVPADFGALSNRCGENSLFDSEALAPMSACCSPSKISTDLVIDWDGTVVACCFDFLRHGTLGTVADGGVRAFLASESRRIALDRFRRKDWAAMPACRDCRIDDSTKVEAMARRIAAAEIKDFELLPATLHRLPALAMNGQALVLRPPAEDEAEAAIRCWGPYAQVQAGRHEVVTDIRFDGWRPDSFGRIELMAGHDLVAAVELLAPTADIGRYRFEMALDQPEQMEIRVITRNLGFSLTAITVTRLPRVVIGFTTPVGVPPAAEPALAISFATG